MPSRESAAVKELWASFTPAAAAKPDQTPQEISDRVEQHWASLTAEPGKTDYLEIEVAGLPALWAVPHGSTENRVILCFHGGGFVSGSPYTHRKLYAHLANAVGARALLTDYRRSPAHPHPAPLEDTTAAYEWLLDRGIAAEHIAIAGDSSGGGLAVSTMLRARDLGLPMAAALLLISPWVDMTVSAATFAPTTRATPSSSRRSSRA